MTFGGIAVADRMVGDTVGEGAARDALARLDAAIGDVARVLDFTADAGSLSEVMGDVIAVQNRFDALVAQYAGQLETSGAPKASGVRTVGQLVAAQTNAHAAPIRAASARARWLRDFALFEEAFAAGDISGSHIDLIKRDVHCGRTHAALRAEQELFIDAARDCSFADFKKVAEYWLIAVDPDGDEPAEQKIRTGLSLRVGRGGRVLIKGELDALSGQALRTAVDRAAQQLALVDRDNNTQRTESERRAEALVSLVTRGAARSDGTHPAPLINIVMSQTVAEHLLAELDKPTNEPVPVQWNNVDGRCELIDGTPIHPRHALAVMGVATFRRHVMNAKSRLIDVSVNARSFPPWMRNALHVQARGACETHGCDAPHHWIQADHVQPHSKGGQTRLADGQNQCSADNQAKTDTTGLLAWRDRRQPPRRQRSKIRSGRDDTDDEDLSAAG